MIKAAFDLGPLSTGHSVRGVGTYVEELQKAMAVIKKKDFKIESFDFSAGGGLKTHGAFDIFHFTSFKPFEISLPFSKPEGSKFILTIYDLTPLIYPDHYPPGVKGSMKWQENKYLISKNVDAIVTISETSKKDICRFTGINPSKVFVTYLAPRPIFKKKSKGKWRLEFRKQYGLPEHFALYVGDLNYNKNIPNLVKACKLAKTPLVIAGKQALEVGEISLDHAELRHLKKVDWEGVLRLGYVETEDLVNLYNLADVYVQPSLYEGFGLPPLEAIVCGTPLAVSKNQCHVEVLGKDFSYFDPKDVNSIAAAIDNPNRGKILPRSYSWEETAKNTIQVYEEI